MQENTTAGKPITADQADKYLKKQVGIREALQKIAGFKDPSELPPGTEKDVATFYSSDVNAFIFSKELIQRFFEPDPKSQTAETANFLMIILGAKYEGELIGRPTVVVAGVNKDEDNKCYHALNITYAGDEQPPTAELLRFPAADGCDPVQFQINH